jgi:uncharacterized protein YdcH (DUF465 family)
MCLELNQKLDIIIELLEKLVEPILLNSNISVNKELMLEDSRSNLQDKNSDFTNLAEVLSSITDRITRANRVPKEVISKEVPKIKVYCRDVDGETIILEGSIQKDGSVICEPLTEKRTVGDP